MTKSKLWKGLGYASRSVFIIEGNQDRNSNRKGTWRQDLMQRPRRSAAYWLTPHGLLILRSYRTQDYQPRDGTTHDRQVLSCQLLRK